MKLSTTLKAYIQKTLKTRLKTKEAFTETPVSVRIEHLRNVSREDAVEYAKGYLKTSMNSSRLFFGVMEYGEGYVVEMHEGGAGLAYLPTITTALEENPRDFEALPLKAVIESGKGLLFVSLKSTTLTALALPRGRHIDVDVHATPSAMALNRAHFSHSKRLLSVSGALLALSLVAYLWAVQSTSHAPTLVVERVATQDTALHQWNSALSWPDSERPVTVIKEGRTWRVETTPLNPLSPLSQSDN